MQSKEQVYLRVPAGGPGGGIGGIGGGGGGGAPAMIIYVCSR